MHHFHAVSGFVQALAYLLGDHDRAVLPAGAAKADRQIALAFVDVVRQQVNQQIGDALNKLLASAETTGYIWPLAGSRPVSGRNSGTKCGLGRKRTSKTRSASSGTPWRKPKLTHETRMFFSVSLLAETLGDVGAQFVHVELGGVDDDIGQGANRSPDAAVRL